MKGLMLRKVILVSLLAVGSGNTLKVECRADKAFSSAAQIRPLTENEIIDQALSRFKKKIQNKDGHPQRISCRFKMHNGKKLETVTKTYFSDYRKKPDYEVETHSAGQPSSVIEVTYVKHDQSLSVAHKDGRGKKRFSTKQVDLPAGFSA